MNNDKYLLLQKLEGDLVKLKSAVRSDLFSSVRAVLEQQVEEAQDVFNTADLHNVVDASFAQGRLSASKELLDALTISAIEGQIDRVSKMILATGSHTVTHLPMSK